MNNKLARFKAKWGVSNTTVASLLQKDFDEVREWASKDTTPEDVEAEIDRINQFCDQLTTTSKMLSDNAPWMEVLKQKNEALRAHLARAEEMNKTLSDIVYRYKRMSFLDRLVFVFTNKIRNEQAYYADQAERQSL